MKYVSSVKYDFTLDHYSVYSFRILMEKISFPVY